VFGVPPNTSSLGSVVEDSPHRETPEPHKNAFLDKVNRIYRIEAWMEEFESSFHPVILSKVSAVPVFRMVRG